MWNEHAGHDTCMFFPLYLEAKFAYTRDERLLTPLVVVRCLQPTHTAESARSLIVRQCRLSIETVLHSGHSYGLFANCPSFHKPGFFAGIFLDLRFHRVSIPKV
ncbi:hypothetical protein BDR07DRAFT_1411809 [Suillus spraguei]|nr:hypothetical protein BDR07DRAFT_1411809 [Suillus spraguei]